MGYCEVHMQAKRHFGFNAQENLTIEKCVTSSVVDVLVIRSSRTTNKSALEDMVVRIRRGEGTPVTGGRCIGAAGRCMVRSGRWVIAKSNDKAGN
jgi:hypothetical protein